MRELEKQYSGALLEDTLPFWEKHSVDWECGGYFTCLDRDGSVYDTDKFVWLQARQVWMFSLLYNRLERRPEWLRIAENGARFLREHGMDANGDWYFALDRRGAPLVQSYNIFSDCFAAMAFSQWAIASGDESAKALAERTYRRIWERRANPKGIYSKLVPGTRPLKSFALPMILCNLTLELEWLLDGSDVDSLAGECVDEVMNLFSDHERGLVFEHVSPDGSHPDCFDGRLVNPGHGIEAMRFVMDFGLRTGDRALIDRAIDMTMSVLQFSWDKEYGGIFYFMDAEGRPPQQLEWDQKLWWVHLETIGALALGYSVTGRSECREWFQKVHEYAWERFPDPEYGEWFGYLNRRGEVLLNLKGGKWKGCFHLPRTLYLCSQVFQGSYPDQADAR